VQAVSRLTPLPVELDLHPRYLKDSSGFCLGCGLQNLEQISVTLMIYIADPDKVARRIMPILEEFSGLSFSVAQSVEPQLAGGGSYAGLSRVQLKEKIHTLEKLVGDRIQGIYIQSWQDYMDMNDEN
jgi:hypothetical protein